MLEYHQLSIEKKMNCLADALASEALVHGAALEQYICWAFPFKLTTLMVGGKRIRGSSRQVLDRNRGDEVAHELFNS